MSSIGCSAWDVERLIELAANLPVRDVPLREIREIDEPFRLEGTDDVLTCREVAEHARLIDESDLVYPIILAADGRVMDELHRVMKALDIGLDVIRAVRFPADPESDHVDVIPDDLT